MCENCRLCHCILTVQYHGDSFETVVRDYGVFFNDYICRACLEQLGRKFFMISPKGRAIKVIETLGFMLGGRANEVKKVA